MNGETAKPREPHTTLRARNLPREVELEYSLSRVAASAIWAPIPTPVMIRKVVSEMRFQENAVSRLPTVMIRTLITRVRRRPM